MSLRSCTRELYLGGGSESLLAEGEEESMEAIKVSPIAIKVAHCDSVRTSLAIGGGKGLARGANELAFWVVMTSSTRFQEQGGWIERENALKSREARGSRGLQALFWVSILSEGVLTRPK